MSDFELGPRLKGIELKGSECINWPGATRNGYGVKKMGETTVPAHKYVYEQSTGKKVPKGWQVDHTCRNRMCINPKHLEAVSPGDNKKRAWDFKLGKYKHKNYKGESKDGKLILVKPKEDKTPVEAVKVSKKDKYDPTTVKELGERYKKERKQSVTRAGSNVAIGAALPVAIHQAAKRTNNPILQAAGKKPSKKTIAAGAATGAVLGAGKIAGGVRAHMGSKRVESGKVNNPRKDWKQYRARSDRDNQIASVGRGAYMTGAGAVGVAASHKQIKAASKVAGGPASKIAAEHGSKIARNVGAGVAGMSALETIKAAKRAKRAEQKAKDAK